VDGLYNKLCYLLIATERQLGYQRRPCVCPSVCLSHTAILSKRGKPRSRNLHCQNAKDFTFRTLKFSHKFERDHPDRCQSPYLPNLQKLSQTWHISLQQKYSAWTVVCGDILFMRVFAGVCRSSCLLFNLF